MLKVDDPKGKFNETLHDNTLLEEAAQEMQPEISTLIKVNLCGRPNFSAFYLDFKSMRKC